MTSDALQIVKTPLGEEIVFEGECDTLTKVYPLGYVEYMMHEACAHRHGTVRQMKAITYE